MRLPDLRQSSLSTTGTYNANLEHLRQRAKRAGYELPDDGLCRECNASLTEVDVVELGACSQCGAVIETKESNGNDDN